MDETEHVEECVDHTEEGCATEWTGFGNHGDLGSELLVRTLYRPGQPPVVQVSLRNHEGQELIADFSPYDRTSASAQVTFGLQVERFGEDIVGEFDSAAREAERFWREQGT